MVNFMSLINVFAKNNYKDCMFNWMQFIYERSTTKSDYDLYSVVRSEQAKMKLYEHKQDYILDTNNEQEKSYVKELLDIYAKGMIKSYFNGLQYTDKKCYELDSNEHFMFSLYCFLSCEYDTMDWKLKDKVYRDKDEEIDGVHFNRHLTDFGRAYYKLWYITTKFCKSNSYTKDLPQILTAENIEDILKSNKVGFFSIRH